MSGKAMVLGVLVALAAAATALAGDDYGPKYWSPTEEVLTPHIAWAKPDAHGPLRVLFIVYRAGMREVVELAQRMDLQYTVFAVGEPENSTLRAFCSKEGPYGAKRAQDRDALTEDLEAKLAGSYDLIVLGQISWSSFPLSLRYEILKKVKDGTPMLGLVLDQDEYFKRAVAKREKPDLTALLPLKGLPDFAKYKDTAALLGATVDCSVFGKGRILTLKGLKVPYLLQMLTPGPAGNVLEPKLVEYDYYLAWIAHLMRFAAGRTDVRVSGADHIAGSRTDRLVLDYSVSGPEGKAVTCAFAFRDDDNQVLSRQEKELRLGAGKTAVSFEAPRAPAGRYYADLWVKEEGRTWAFGSSFVELSGDPVVEGIAMEKDYRSGDKIAGSVKVMARGAAEGLSLVLRQRDTYGRVVSQARMAVPALAAGAARELGFELPGGTPLTIVQRLEAELWRGDDLLARKARVFSISDLPAKDDIRVVVWGGMWSPSYLNYHYYSELAKAGFDTQYGGFSELSALFNIRHISNAVRLADLKSDWYPHPEVTPRAAGDHVRSPCLTDPEYLRKLAADLTKRAEQVKPFSTMEFSLGDECHFCGGTAELCFSPTCVAAFHKFLAAEYPSVEAMNREYGTRCKTFDEVRPVTLGEVAENPGLRPLWVDYRRHMENTWAGAFPACADVLHKVVPGAKVGYEGSDTVVNSYRAADFWKLMKAMRINGTYDGAFVPYAVMNFAEPGTLLGLGWYGGYDGSRYPEFQRYIAWRHLFRGANSYWVFLVDPTYTMSVMAPDFSIDDFFKPNVAEVGEIKRGIGKLLMTSKRADDGIAILYSASSVHAATLTNVLPSMEKALNALTPLFEDTGHQFKIISYAQVADGELKRGGYRVLWLPYAQALSPKEVAAVEAFVGGGGTVVADLRPGVCDEHGKPHGDGGALDEVFGVKQKTDGPVLAKGAVKINWDGWSKTLPDMVGDGSVGLGTGTAKAALGDKPALIVNQYGKGKAVLLNFSLSAYAEVAGGLETSAVKAGANTRDIAELFRVLLGRAGVGEAVKVEPEIAGLRLYRFERDGLGYLGALQELPDTAKAYIGGTAKPLAATSGDLKLGGKKHVYDSRSGKYLGFSDRISVSVEPAKGMLFALLPYEVKSVEVGVPARIGQGETLRYQVEIKADKEPGTHVFHVELAPPKGGTPPCYVDNVVGEKGRCQGSFPLAFNDMVGQWEIRVRDAATGVTAARTFSVEGRDNK